MKPFLLLGAALAVTLAGCESGKGPGRPAASAAATAPASLTGTTWKLVELRGQPVTPPDTPPEPQLVLRDDGQVGGWAGCNRLIGPWKSDGGDGLRIGPIATTRMGCLATPEQEQRFLAALADTRRQRHAGQRLELLDERGAVLARLQAAGTPR